MLGLTLREEFRGKRLKGTAIELSNDTNTGATQVAAKSFLEITYPTHDLLKGIEAVDGARRWAEEATAFRVCKRGRERWTRYSALRLAKLVQQHAQIYALCRQSIEPARCLGTRGDRKCKFFKAFDVTASQKIRKTVT